MNDNINNPLYMLETPGLAEKLAQIRQGAAQTQGAGLLQTLLSEAMKPSGRTGGVPSAGSPGVMLPTSLPSVAMPRPPVKDKSAAARDYKKQQQGALKKTFETYNKGKEGDVPYTIQEFFAIGTANGVESSTLVPIAQSLQSTGAADARLKAAEKLAVGKKEAARTLATAKTTAAGKIAEAKRTDVGDELYTMTTNLEMGEDELVDEDAVIDISAKAQKYVEKDKLDNFSAVRKARQDYHLKNFEPAQMPEGIFQVDNYDETVDEVSRLKEMGVEDERIKQQLIESGRPKTGDQSIEEVLEDVGITSIVEPETEIEVPEVSSEVSDFLKTIGG